MNPKTIILTCRTVEKASKAREEILDAIAPVKPDIRAWALELGSFASVKAFAKRVKDELGTVDILLENAGLACPTWTQTEDGWETVIQVNVLSTFLLGLLLLPNLAKSSQPRLVIVSSDVHQWTDLADRHDQPNILASFNDPKLHAPSRYPESKLLEVLIARSLIQHLPSAYRDVSICLVNPGLCVSELSRNRPADARREVFKKARTTEMGSRTLVDAVLRTGMKGTFLSACEPTNVSEFAASEKGDQIGKKLYEETLDVLKKIAPELQADW